MVAICGDINAHTNVSQDYMDIDQYIADRAGIDIEHDQQFSNTQDLELYGIPLTRTSKDVNRVNAYGRRLLSFCKDNDIYICKDSSVIDYMITSPTILCNVHKFEIQPFDALFSDRHKLINISVKCTFNDINVNNVLTDNAVTFPVWNQFKCHEFVDELNSDNVKETTKGILDNENCNVNVVTDVIEKIYQDCAKKVFVTQKN